MEDRLLSILGICRKAGKINHGFKAAADSVKKHEAVLVLTTKDLSQKTKKEIIFISDKENIEVVAIPVTMDEIAWKTGRRAGILAITDYGLAKSVKMELQRGLPRE